MTLVGRHPARLRPVHELTRLLAEEPANVIRDISPQDDMYEGDEPSYFAIGQSALRYVRLAMLAAGKEEAKNILDLPCGYGRVLRTLKAAFPNANVTACDLDRDGVDFCSTTFGATPIYSKRSPKEIEIDDTFDLIWCGSLLTHLDSYLWQEFLSLFERSMSPSGILVFTTHGRLTAEQLGEIEGRGMDLVRPPRNILRDYEDFGFGYSDYQHARRQYGISVSSPAWVCGQLAEVPSLRLIGCWEAGWGSYQDVVACERVEG